MKTAILLDDTSISDLTYHVMSELNNSLDKEHDCFLLVNNISSRVIRANFAVINSTKINCLYGGLLIATNVSTANIVNAAVVNACKILYLYELEWLNTVYDYNRLYDLLNSSDLKLICRSELHAQLLDNLFDRKVDGIIPEFRLEEIWNLLENTKTS